MLNISKDALEERYSFYTDGPMYMPYKCELLILIVLCSLIFLSAAYILVTFSANCNNVAELALIAIFIYITLVNVTVHGERNKYSADSKSFVIELKKKRLEFFYCDVTNIKYKQYKFLCFNTRLTVTISTKYRTDKLTYFYPRSVIDKTPKNTPFRIIEERAGLINKDD